jgi:CRP-like cAMP-binding protein
MRKILYILGHLSEHDIDWLISVGHRETLAPGEVLIQKGTHSPAVYILLDGELDVFMGKDANSPRISTMFYGELVGELSFVDANPASATVIAKRESVLFVLPTAILVEKLKADAAFGRNFYRAIAIFLSDRLRVATQTADGATQDDDGLDPNVLDSVYLAGTRFDQMIQKMLSV